MVKNLPAMQESWVQSLGQEDLLEKGMATHSSILAWRIPWTEESNAYSNEIYEPTLRAATWMELMCIILNKIS